MSLRPLGLTLLVVCGCTRPVHLPTTLVADDLQAVFDTVDHAPSSERVLTFTNEGDEDSAPLAVALSGDVHAFHVIADQCSGTRLRPKLSCSIDLHLASDDPGAFAGELHVSSGFVAAEVLLSGKVTPAQLELAPVKTTELNVVQGESAELRFTVSNRGGATSGVLEINLHTFPFDRVLGDCAGKVLVGGASCNLVLTRTVALDAPLGVSSGALDVAAAPGGDPSTTVSIVVHNGAVLVVDDAPFGTVPTLGGTQRVVGVINPGPITVGPLSITIGPAMYPPFHLASDSCTGTQLAAGKRCQVTVIADPTATGPNMATLTASAPNVRSGHGSLTANAFRAHYAVLLTFAGNGSGKVRWSGTEFASTVGFDLRNHEQSTPFIAVPDSGSTFAGWSGTAPCSGTGTCSSFVGADNSDLTLTATFTR